MTGCNRRLKSKARPFAPLSSTPLVRETGASHSLGAKTMAKRGCTASDRRPVHRQWLNKNAGLLIKAHVIS
jgi:hypothetical protein